MLMLPATSVDSKKAKDLVSESSCPFHYNRTDDVAGEEKFHNVFGIYFLTILDFTF
jgi:hypothetical protein